MPVPKKPVMDITKPGTTPADATTRPIITSHEMIKDPMVAADAGTKPATTEETEADAGATTVATAPHKVIEPIDPAPAEPEKAGELAPEEAQPAEDAQSSDDAVVDAVLEQVSDKNQETKDEVAARQREELVTQLTTDKKYFLPINQVRKRRNSRRVVATIFVLLLLVLALGAVIDAGYIDPGFTLPVDFIKDVK